MPALHDFQRWGKRYAGTLAEAPYVTSVSFDVQGSFADDNAVPPDEYSYGISTVKEGQTRIDAFNTFEMLSAPLFCYPNSTGRGILVERGGIAASTDRP